MKRKHEISGFPQLERDLYLIFDIVAITCDAGTGAWIHYHHDEPDWMDRAAEAFIHIGYPEISDGIKHCLDVYLSRRDAMTYEDDEVVSNRIMDHEHDIMRSLYIYLVVHGFKFHSDNAQ
ncbi:MAG TPA: hypothetical protein VK811_08165 [Candidatus Acidoferrum sp.]|nr:hypothetical protein [Candidatus Acidoferrum sp.]